jgi:RNA polymerase-binding transcription factor DksA
MSSEKSVDTHETSLIRLRSTYVERETRPGTRAAEDLGRILARIDAALERIRSGSFGICGSCNLDIGIDYLEKDPATPFCRSCFEELLDQRRTHQRGY